MKYLRALCRNIPRSIVNLGLRQKLPSSPFNYELAVKQHEDYITALRNAGISDIKILESDESLPDCVFVEDTAIVIGQTALITNPGASSRKLETISVLKHFKNSDCIKNIHIMTGPACCDGGDVLFTGKEIFVGISRRSNLEGVVTIKNVFNNFPVHALDIGSKHLHLKSFLSMLNENTIALGKSETAQFVKKQLLNKACEKYEFFEVSDDYAANVIYANGVLIHRSVNEFPESFKLFNNLPVKTKISLNCSEISKVDGALTCCSILY
ncbi:N(G),N(G)-dimethylarginine dimethylaminohydrolase 1-like isoform X1 [Hydra vulgaris]|uniref:N(G),N(G)-dimethylarginine dimethylaminohydrolase 1-like isoform X1 n=1 Tax=Hydra vulgaris TaxID=6087 RepID=UPI00019243F0|nr:N(G),N(G)-dimethylarginine dimethylaminohydrolase 1-like [Hydra vulgaris]XP_047130469.1 N(G),N(G)-dimethylarginine dimethylaminohydrolase 1-like [Hydra vulgaris]XP_047130470.1 N(G),N(G)-dimethylarginine dimethylaminohydrolase 1-like [Hydra vulgaris]